MTRKKLFSVIVPIYNVENYLSECIESILNQTYEKFELILVDDGSTDNSGAKCDFYKKIDDRIKVIHKKNGGLSDARNAGIQKATGEYLMFVDGDDFLYTNYALEKLSKALKNYHPDILQYKTIYKYKNRNIEQKDIKDINQVADKFKALRILNKNGNVSVSACDKIIKRKTIIDNELLFETNLLSEDIKWSYQLYLKISSLKSINEPIYVYRQQRQGSITSAKSAKNMNDIYMITKYWIDYRYDTEDIKNLYYNMVAYWYLILRTNFPRRYHTEEVKKFFADWDRYILNYNENYKVKKASRLSKVIGVRGTLYTMKVYLFLKDKGIIRL